MSISEEVLNNYNKIISKQKESVFYKVDFHIHTPGSKKDYKFNEKYYENVTIKELEERAKSNGLAQIDGFDNMYCNKDELMALLIIHEAYKIKKLNLIVITDHNNMDYYEYVTDAAIKYLKSNLKSGNQFCILPGVEITCFSGTHIIGIFDNINYQKIWEYMKFELNGIQGEKENIFTEKSEMDVINIIKKCGGIVYVPHINNTVKKSLKEFLEPLSGDSKIQLLTSKDVDAIGVTKYEFVDLVKQTLENKKNMYYRKYPLAYLQDSDAHCIDEIGTKPMYIKMEKPGFDFLKFALEDPKLRVKVENIETKNIPYIMGVATLGGYLSKRSTEYEYYQFCKDLNCIIGGRGSGKSTLIKSIESCLKQRTPNYKFRLFMGDFSKILIYIYYNGIPYCILCTPSINKDPYSGKEINRQGDIIKGEIMDISNWIKIYKISKNKCTKITENEKNKLLNEFYIDYFDQAQIFEIGKDEHALKTFMESIIVKTHHKENYNKVNKEIKQIKNKFPREGVYNKKVQLAYDKLQELYKIKDNIIRKSIDNLNSSLRYKVVIEYNRIIDTSMYLLDIALEDYSLNNELTIINNKKLSLLIEKLFSKYTIFELSEKINSPEYYKDIISEIRTSGILNNTSIKEFESDRTSFDEYIKIFSMICSKALDNVVNANSRTQYSIKFNVNSNENNRKVLYKNISDLSLGQRAVAILTIITEGITELDVNVPLIIDQPEDQLDNRFIYEHLIKTIRKLKEKKQIIFVTHNANIPVCGDAENILCLTSDNECGWVDYYGSIEDKKIQERIIKILEGGKESFKMRLMKYKI
ncbi:hypothetical protein [Clostridium butyricum]|uniref:hypothetical protein n=1 Tax=Clostridium butyricum TaxID=1492 RepID=UPI0024BAE383|nr:hypothetical protein [Clostridium butyricum]